MTEMVNRVRHAILQEARRIYLQPVLWTDADALARAAIKEMREPTDAMLDRRLNTWATFPERMREDWQTMIDAALKEPDRE